MKLPPHECCVLNSGDGSWAFESLAKELSATLAIDISDTPRRFNYLLYLEKSKLAFPFRSFIPLTAIQLASDKRLLADVFKQHEVPTPLTMLFDDFGDVRNHLRSNSSGQWCLKYPTSSGANGHRLASEAHEEPPNWPKPYILQEFIPLAEPEVYRTYCTGCELFGWVVRRFPAGSKPSPWVAHARGARYVQVGNAPFQALEAAKRALLATGLWHTFGCVDLICKPTGEWVVLEVGTDGLFNHVDREIGDYKFENQLRQKIAGTFWQAATDK